MAEIVKVIRCKNCKHFGQELVSGTHKTRNFCGCHKGLVVVSKDTYCSYAERRVDNATDVC